jgi:protein-S-isoprenylcysteine O-methyltransferase Ste14
MGNLGGLPIIPLSRRNTEKVDNRTIGWIFVACQAVLLLALILLPTGDAWRTPSWLSGVGFATVAGGLAIVAFASLNLGNSLTATPVPNGRGQLKTGGMYSRVRHPIYSGVLLIVVGLVVRSANWMTLAVGIATISFFHTKAQWEERQLAEHFEEYGDYATTTPRFVPRLRSSHREA